LSSLVKISEEPLKPALGAQTGPSCRVTQALGPTYLNYAYAHRRLRFLFLAACFWSGPARASDPVVFRSDVSLVRVDAQVMDRENRVITGLGPRDFLLDQGRLQPVQSVDTENLPVDLVLLRMRRSLPIPIAPISRGKQQKWQFIF
jgi:hypothetical protein